jgi:hypothetical protein
MARPTAARASVQRSAEGCRHAGFVDLVRARPGDRHDHRSQSRGLVLFLQNLFVHIVHADAPRALGYGRHGDYDIVGALAATRRFQRFRALVIWCLPGWSLRRWAALQNWIFLPRAFAGG